MMIGTFAERGSLGSLPKAATLEAAWLPTSSSSRASSMPARRRATTPNLRVNDLFCVPTHNLAYGRISECQELLSALEAQGHRIYKGADARFLVDVRLRIARGVDTPELNNRWRAHIERITTELLALMRLKDPLRMANFLASADGQGITLLHNWDYERGGGIPRPKLIVPVLQDGEVIGHAHHFGPGEGRPIRRKPDPSRTVIGELNPPLEPDENRMFDLFFKMFPRNRRANPRGQPMLRHWRLEGPSAHIAVDGTIVLNYGALLLFLRRYSSALEAYEDANLAKGKESRSDRRQRARARLLEALAGIVGGNWAEAWLARMEKPLPRKGRGTEHNASPRLWLFCRMTAEAVGSRTAALTVHKRLLSHTQSWNRLVKAYPSAVTAFPPSPNDKPPRTIDLRPHR